VRPGALGIREEVPLKKKWVRPSSEENLSETANEGWSILNSFVEGERANFYWQQRKREKIVRFSWWKEMGT